MYDRADHVPQRPLCPIHLRQFRYRVKTATDNIGREVQYSYDASGRLQTVIDANSGTWTYGYDSLNRMTTIQDPRLITYLTNVYDSSGRVYQQYLADGTSFYQFNWTPTSNTQNVTFTANRVPADRLLFSSELPQLFYL